MSASIANKLSRSPHLTDNEITALITEMQGFRDNVSEAAEKDIYIPFAEDIRLRQQTFSVRSHILGTTPAAENRVRVATRNDTTMIRHVTKESKSYPLTHTTFGTPAFRKDTSDQKYGGGLYFDGSTYLTIDDHARLKPTNEMTIAFFARLQKPPSGSIPILSKGTNYGVDLLSNGKLQFDWNTPLGPRAHNVTIPDDTWVFVGAKFDNAGIRVYLNDATPTSAAFVTTITTNTDKLAIGADDAVGTTKISSGNKLAWLTLLNDSPPDSWFVDYYNGLLDTDGRNEITTIPFAGTVNPQPESTFGLAV